MIKLPTNINKRLIAGILLGVQIFGALIVPSATLAAGPDAMNSYCYEETVSFGVDPTTGTEMTALDSRCFPDGVACKTSATTAGADASGCAAPISPERLKPVIQRIAEVPGKVLAAGVDAVVGGVLGIVLSGIAWVAELINEVAAIFLKSMAYILDMSIMRTIDSATYKNLQVVNIGWTAVRDISNMFFIFVLLYIAIQTILGIAGGSAKRMVATLIVAAVLINFSLFMTQVVIDSGNVLAMGFWNKILTKQGDIVGSSASAQFMQGFRIQTVYSPTDLKIPAGGTRGPLAQTDRIKINLGGALVMVVAGYVMLVGAVLMIIRTVTLLIVMIASPFAFLAFALPKGSGMASKWLGKLIGATFVAPVFIFMLYLDSKIITSLDIVKLAGANQSSFSMAADGVTTNFAIIYNFALLIILLLATITVAQSVSNGVGGSASGFAKKGLGMGGAMAMGTAAYGLRRTVGAGSDKLKNNERLQDMAQQKGLRGTMARTLLSTANVGAKASFDVRGAPGMGKLGGLTGVNFGSAGGAGGERARRQKSNQDIIKKAEELFPNNPLAQDAYIRKHSKLTNIPMGSAELNQARSGTFSPYDAKPGKYASKEDKALFDKRMALDREATVFKAKETLKKAIDGYGSTDKGGVNEYEKDKARLEVLKEEKRKDIADGKTPDPAKDKEIEDLGNKIRDGVKEFSDAIKELTGKEFADLSLGVLKNKLVQENANTTQLQSVLMYDKEKGYSDPQLLPSWGKTLMESDNTAGKNWLRKTASMQPGAFGLDFKREVEDMRKQYDGATDPAVKAGIQKDIARSMGYMDPKDIQDWDESLITHDAVASNITKQQLAKLVEKQKNDSSYDDAFFAAIAAAIAANGNSAAQSFIRNAKGDHPFAGHAPKMPKPASAKATPGGTPGAAPTAPSWTTSPGAAPTPPPPPPPTSGPAGTTP